MPAFNYQSPYAERVFIQAQPNLTTVQNNGGGWNSAGASFIRVMDDSLHIKPEEPLVSTNWKHGTASQLQKIKGRKSASWSLNAPLVPSGTQAVPPDTDTLLQSIFGGAGALATGTAFGNAWEYQVHDQASIPVTLLGFQHGQPATGNRYAVGCVPQKLTIDLNGNILGLNTSGVAVSAVENETFSVVDQVAQGGLTSYPGEPGSYSANGSLINAFGGSLYINGVQYSNMCDSFSVEYDTGFTLKGNYVDSAYPLSVIYGRRSAKCSIGFVNNDSTALATLKQLGRTSAPVTVAFYLGTIPGQRVYFILKGVQFTADDMTDQGAGYIAILFSNAESSATPGTSDDFRIGFA